MYAIIKTGGKQYKVAKDQRIKIEQLAVNPGDSVEFEDVLMVVDDEKITVGKPFIAKTKVVAEVIEHGRGKKIRIIKFKRRKHHMKHLGHRQNYTEVKITDIQAA